MALNRILTQLRPIVAALTRHKVATLLIVLQVALTLAAASNALFIVATRVVHLSRPTGTDEAHLFVIRNHWKNGQNATQIDANLRADIAALRRVPGVRNVFSSEAFPLEGGGAMVLGLKLKPEQTTRPKISLVYFADEHAIDTLGVSLVEGRNFRGEEIATLDRYDKVTPPGIIVTRSLAHKLYPEGSALGGTVYLPSGPTKIIGVLASLQGAYAGSTTRSIDEDSVLIPARSLDPDGVVYLVRTDGTSMTSVIDTALKALQERGGVRRIDPAQGVITLAQARDDGYATDRSVVLLMSVVCGLLLFATAGGIVGLSSFWVSQRRRQIGIRRSLGATRGDILRYFHIENFVIVSGGVALGGVLAFLANLCLMHVYELPGMPLYVPLWGALALWLLGQLAVWGPARYAAKVPPVVAIRNA
ncbi:putative ABC transport system permease protein [Luteibacter sp. OK325]|uniref:ABC transporter permease n=1 Tax=Luteibacter sp. OK325 TaxID=2135670 RepID=UPI000D34D3E8|nr:FtsX-like permease family protein [Luteibacter sp. OK325]PTR32489.1 putative ABC transport system permease protein [Luteibacter sp. OK325]